MAIKSAALINQYLDAVNVSLLPADERRLALSVLKRFIAMCNTLGDLSLVRSHGD